MTNWQKPKYQLLQIHDFLNQGSWCPSKCIILQLTSSSAKSFIYNMLFLSRGMKWDGFWKVGWRYNERDCVLKNKIYVFSMKNTAVSTIGLVRGVSRRRMTDERGNLVLNDNLLLRNTIVVHNLRPQSIVHTAQVISTKGSPSPCSCCPLSAVPPKKIGLEWTL